MQDRPLLDRINPASTRALIAWAVSYALNHREEITPADIAKLRNGNEAQRRAGELLARYGLDLTRDTASR
jgi:hypothetical protein